MPDKYLDELSRLLTAPTYGPEEMIAQTRAILRYASKLGYDLYSETLVPFASIDDQTDHILLQGYDQFNYASPRYKIDIVNGERLESDGPLIGGGHPEYASELSDLWQSFRDVFEESRLVLKRELKQKGREHQNGM